MQNYLVTHLLSLAFSSLSVLLMPSYRDSRAFCSSCSCKLMASRPSDDVVGYNFSPTSMVLFKSKVALVCCAKSSSKNLPCSSRTCCAPILMFSLQSSNLKKGEHYYLVFILTLIFITWLVQQQSSLNIVYISHCIIYGQQLLVDIS